MVTSRASTGKVCGLGDDPPLGLQNPEMDRSFEEKMDLIASAFTSLNVKEQNQVLSRLLRVCQLPQLKKIYTELSPLLSIDFVLILPQELVERIFSYLSAEDLFRMACCNRSWREFTNTDILWQPLCAVQNWLNFDTDQQLFSKNQYSCSPTGLTSPRYSTSILSDFPSLSPTCRWKEIYIRACHLNQNWALGRYTVLPLLRGHQERVDCLDCDGKRLVSGSSDKTARVWDLFTASCLHVLDSHTDAVTSVCIKLPQLKKIYTELSPLLSIDFVLILPQELVERIFSYLSAEDLFRMACCNRSWREFTNTDILWQPLCAVQNWLNFDTDQQLFSKSQYSYSPTGLTSPRYSTSILSDFPSLSPTCRWKEIYIRACHLNQNWALGRYTVLPLLRGHQERVDCLDCDGKRLVSGSSDKTARVWDLFTASCLHVLDSHTDAVTSVCIKNEVIITGCADSLIRIFQTETGTCLRALMGHNSGIDHLCFDGTQVVSASSDRTLRVWSIQDGRCRKILRGHEDEIQYLAMKKHLVVSTSWDHTVRMWNIQRGVCTAVLKGHTEVVNCCQFDGRYVVSGGGDCLVLIWSTDSGKLLCKCQGHTGDVYCLMFNEKTICSGSSDSSIRVWDFTGKCLFTMTEHIGVVRCLHLDGNRLVSGGDRKKILVWDVANGKLINVVHRNPSLLHKVWINETKVITASPESPGILTILSYW